MSGVGIKVNVAEVLTRLKGMEDRGGNLSGLMRSFGEYMKGSIAKNFDAEGRPTRWPPLSLATLLGWAGSRKSFTTKKGNWSQKGQKALAGRKILTDTARLRRSINYVAGGRFLQVGTNVVYAAIHQFGGQAGRGKKVTLPPRPYLMFQEEDVAYFDALYLNYLLTGNLG